MNFIIQSRTDTKFMDATDRLRMTHRTPPHRGLSSKRMLKKRLGRRSSVDGKLNAVSDDLKGFALGNFMHNHEVSSQRILHETADAI